MTAVLTYKEYQGCATYEDGRIVVKILHIDDFITDECVDASKVQALFEDMVDDYIATCEAVGKSPQKPFKGSFNVRVESELHRKSAMAAMRSDMSLNAWVETAMKEHLAREDRVVEMIAVARHRAMLPRAPLGRYVAAEEVREHDILKREIYTVLKFASPSGQDPH